MQTAARRKGVVTTTTNATLYCLALAAAAVAASARSPQASSPPSPEAAAAAAAPTESATAELRDATGKAVGTARLTGESTGAVRLVVHVDGMTAGDHGIHFHAVGSCGAPGDSVAFAAAGGHHNPLTRKHGLENPDGPHAGDLPNLPVGANGSGDLDTRTALATLRDGPTTLLDANGSALVVHAAADDQKTDPSGNSGARVACGVLTAGGR